MAKEITMYEAKDGKQFKTKQGAENHDRRNLVKAKLEELGMTKEEITDKLHEVAKYNKTIKRLLAWKKDWSKQWPIHLINQIDKDLFKEPQKKTIYVKLTNSYKPKEIELAQEEGDDFADPEKHVKVNGDYEEYKVLKTEQVDEFTLKVFYEYKYSKVERIKMKLDSGVDLSESEIEYMIDNLPETYEEEGDSGRWDVNMLTVVELMGDKYAINWSKGLTEMQENTFYEQPYKVKVEEKEVMVKQTFVTRI